MPSNQTQPMQWSPTHGFVPATGNLPVSITEAADVDDADDQQPYVLSGAVKPAPRRPPPKAVTSPKQVVQLAKARLRDIKVELRRMKALEKERAELERLIAAAEVKPRAVVREVKRTAG